MAKRCDGETIPRACSDQLAQFATALGRIEGGITTLTQQTAENAAKTSGQVGELFDRVHGCQTRVAVLEAARGPEGESADRSALRAAAVGLVKSLPIILAAIAALVAALVWLVKRVPPAAVIAAVILMMGGCTIPKRTTPGRAEVDLPGYGHVTVNQPEAADAPATIVVELFPYTEPPPTDPSAEPTADDAEAIPTPKIRVTVSTGSTQPPTPAAIAAEHAKLAWFIGPGIMLLGVGLIYLRARWMPRMPTSMIAGTMIVGAGVLAFGIAGPSIPNWVWTVGVLSAFGIVGVLVIPGYIANRRKERREVAAATSPRPPGRTAERSAAHV